MKQFIRQERKFLAAMLLILVLIFAGIFMVFRVFQQYESLIIENEDRQLLGLTRSVDRSITSYLQQISRDLQHTLQRDGIQEAEATYRPGTPPTLPASWKKPFWPSIRWLTTSFAWRAKPSCIPRMAKPTIPSPPTPGWKGRLPSAPVWTRTGPSIFPL